MLENRFKPLEDIHSFDITMRYFEYIVKILELNSFQKLMYFKKHTVFKYLII